MSKNSAAENYRSASILIRPFCLDVRSLAVFRIVIGLLIIADLLFRFPSAVEMYTDEGFVTRQLSFDFFTQYYDDAWQSSAWSVYWLNGSEAFLWAMFGLSAIAAAFLIVGKWTRVATIVCWIMLVSLHNRNPLVITSGDFFFKMMLFWSIFLPLGAVWSLDARSNRPSDSRSTSVFSIASVGFVLQLIFIYFFPGLAKLNEIWFSGDAMTYVLRLDIYITRLGRSLLDYPLMLKYVTWVTLAAEVIWIWTLLLPWKNSWFRVANLLLFWSFHVGIALAMSIGLFPFICMAGWLPLIPGICWRRATTEVQKYNWIEMGVVSRLGQVTCAMALLLVTFWNITNIEHASFKFGRPRPVAHAVLMLGLDQHFQMFGKPPVDNPWFVYAARLDDGSEIDIMRKNATTHDRPEWVREIFPTFHWRKVHRNLLSEKLKGFRQPLLDYFVEKWNHENSTEKQVAHLRLHCYLESIGPSYNQGLDRTSIVWGSFENEQTGSGSVFDSILEDDDIDTPF